jgi:predicted Zn-dependent peptidase
MTTPLIRKELAHGVAFSAIRDPKFKHNRLSVSFVVPLREETASDYAMLALLLRKGCRSCPDFTKLNQTLDSLYGADLASDVAKIGACQIVSFSVTTIDSRYALHEENLLRRCAELLRSVLLEPLIENGAFPAHDVEIERRFLIDTIEAEINDKRAYAVTECRRLMGKNDPASLCKYGTIEGAQRTTTETTAAAYYELLRTARIEISFTGSGEWEDALDIFGDAFAPRGDDMSEFVLPRIRERADQITEHTDTFDVVQSKLVMGFRTGARPTLTEQSAIRLAVAIFGGTPSSKLFLNVREKLSLCYYCSARYDRAGAVMLVDSGVESENIIPAREEILRQLDDLKRGDFSDETMQNTRLQMVNALRGVSDSAGAIEDWYLNRILIGEMSTPEQEIELLEATTREEIIEAANRITLDTVYLLTAQEGGEA